jgi:hypothetical protein
MQREEVAAKDQKRQLDLLVDASTCSYLLFAVSESGRKGFKWYTQGKSGLSREAAPR